MERGRTIVKEAGNNEYFENRENRYVNTIKIEDKLSLGYFVSGNNIYPINESLIIPVEHLKFEYFFALKLRQYEGGQKYIEEYLNYYHLKFIESKLDFNKLLKIVLMQYEEIIDKRVI